MADLETTMLALCRVGKPHLGVFSTGWQCNVDMHVAATGATFNVASEFGHASPHAAADECASRVETIMHGFATGASAKAITHG